MTLKKTHKWIVLLCFLIPISVLLLLFLSFHIIDQTCKKKWEKYLTDLRKKGYRTSLEEIYSEDTNRENSAPLWQEAIAKFHMSDKAFDAHFKFIRNLPTRSKEREILQETFRDNEETIKLIKKAVMYPYKDPSFPLGMSKMLRVLIQTRGRILSDEGKLMDAVDVLFLDLQIIRSVAGIHSFLGSMFGTTFLHNHFELSYHVLSGKEIPVKKLQDFINLLDPEFFREQFRESLDYERIVLINPQLAYAYPFSTTTNMMKNIIPLTVASRNMGDPINPSQWVVDSISWDIGYQIYVLNRPLVYRDLVYIQEKFIEMIQASQEPYDRAKNVFINVENETNKLPESHLLPYITLAHVSPWLFRVTRGLIEIHILRIALACKLYKAKYGRFPISLHELSPEILEQIPNDPFNGQNIQYKQFEEKGFVVYSMGDDGLDNCKKAGTFENFQEIMQDQSSGDDIFWFEKSIEIETP